MPERTSTRPLVLLLGVLALAGTARADTYPPPIVGFHVAVTCDMQAPPPPNQYAEGVYHDLTTHTIQLRPIVCDSLRQAVAGQASDQSALALLLLGHELTHSYGMVDEDGANCIGAQLVAWVGTVLGVPAAALDYDYNLAQVFAVYACAAWDRRGDPWQS